MRQLTLFERQERLGSSVIESPATESIGQTLADISVTSSRQIHTFTSHQARLFLAEQFLNVKRTPSSDLEPLVLNRDPYTQEIRNSRPKLVEGFDILSDRPAFYLKNPGGTDDDKLERKKAADVILKSDLMMEVFIQQPVACGRFLSQISAIKFKNTSGIKSKDSGIIITQEQLKDFISEVGVRSRESLNTVLDDIRNYTNRPFKIVENVREINSLNQCYPRLYQIILSSMKPK
jgi:hypothetical protein